MKELYACIECGFETPKWMGRCIRCGTWESLKKVEKGDEAEGKTITRLKVVKIPSARRGVERRISTKLQELDRVLGGGLVKGEVILLGGEPGIGKTTLLLQLVSNINSLRYKCAYVSAEESQEQITIHAKRLGVKKKLDVICGEDIDSIIATLKEDKYGLVILDSIQTVKTNHLKGLPGGVGQVKECTTRIVNFAKKTGATFFLVGHVTKSKELAGPKMIEHLVDVVFYIDSDNSNRVRFIRAVKNRFGSTQEIGVFNFTRTGFVDASNPAEMFIASKDPRVGVCKGIIFEGRRAILIEVQALTTRATFSVPQRIVSGIRKSKVQMLCALLTKYTKANFLDKDVYVNIANGLKVDDSSLDLSICFALLSTYFDREVDPGRVCVGEVSLTGQIHSPGLLEDKVKALGRLGYKQGIILPKEASSSVYGVKKALRVSSVKELQEIL
ncbi:DNA repair protein RadA [Candidatus Dojkabacteria bacterium]|nr:DNA repair protein RadA [Candidatus Dojkabacteria bacterium]